MFKFSALFSFADYCILLTPGLRHPRVYLGVTRSPAGDLSLSSMVLHPLGEQSCCAPLSTDPLGSAGKLKEVLDRVIITRQTVQVPQKPCSFTADDKKKQTKTG